MRPGVKEVTQKLGGKDTVYKLNEEGFRGPVREKCDIAVLGDSMTFGVGAEFDEVWSEVLAEKSGLIVANYARCGACPQQERILMQRHALEKKPDLVLCCIYYSDFAEAGIYQAWKESGYTWSEFIGMPVSPGRWRLKIYIEGLLLGKWGKKIKPPRRATSADENRKYVGDAITGMKDDCKAAGVRFALVLFPSIDVAYGEKKYPAPRHYIPSVRKHEKENYRYLKKLCVEKGIAYLNIVDRLRIAVAAGRENLFVAEDIHFSVKGNAFVAEEIHTLLQSTDLLPKKDTKPVEGNKK